MSGGVKRIGCCIWFEFYSEFFAKIPQSLEEVGELVLNAFPNLVHFLCGCV